LLLDGLLEESPTPFLYGISGIMDIITSFSDYDGDGIGTAD
jgi:hypothetical protein